MKKQIGIFIAILFAVSTLMVGCKAEVHTHTFAEEWSSDETNHWHAATCEHKDEVINFEEHSFGDWTITKEPTEEAEGSKEKSCSVCEHKVTEVIAKLEHTHTFGEWKVTKEPTEDAKGSKERVCDICKCKETAEIAQLNHKHVTGESWETDDKNHWKECTGCKEKLESAEHEYEWTVTKDETCTDEGSKTGVCEVCKKEVTEKIDVKEHSYSESWTKDASGHWHACVCGAKKDFEEHTYDTWKVVQEATCTQAGKKTVWCTVCEYEKEETIPAKGHSYSGSWKNDDKNHWKECTGCKEKLESAEHEYGWTVTKEPTETESGQMKRACKVCGGGESVTKELQPAPKGFRFVKGVTITGTESWTPESEVFVSGRSLTIPDLIVSDHEVTRGEYKAVMGKDPSTASAYDKAGNELEGDAVLNNPVNYVRWYDALVYCNKRSMAEGLTPCYSIKQSPNPDNWGTVPTEWDDTWDAATCNFDANGYRLPTEAEWEWLARGGENYKYAGSDNVDDVAWTYSNTNDSGTREVKTKASNGYGLYDMSGNVWEWCWDWWDGDISDSTAADGATSSSFGSFRVPRGGSWLYDYYGCPVAERNCSSPCDRYSSDGFRVVRLAN